MQGTIAQVIALTTYGNAFLSGRGVNGFYPGNTTFTFCEHVRFVDLRKKGGGWEELPYAPDPVAWFGRIQSEGACAIRMRYLTSGGEQLGDSRVADRMLVSLVGGGGRWLVEVLKESGSDVWEARWEVGDKERKDQRIWRVTYGRIAVDQSLPNDWSADSVGLKERLATTLEAISAFARVHKLDGFAKAFETGVSALKSEEPLKALYHSDIAPDGVLPVPASQLLATAQAAWVFGGMGSWNDLGFKDEDQSTYERLSEDLYQLLNKAIVVAANASARNPTSAHSKPWWKLWT